MVGFAQRGKAVSQGTATMDADDVVVRVADLPQQASVLVAGESSRAVGGADDAFQGRLISGKEKAYSRGRMGGDRIYGNSNGICQKVKSGQPAESWSSPRPY